jgi:hypothetical protein
MEPKLMKYSYIRLAYFPVWLYLVQPCESPDIAPVGVIYEKTSRFGHGTFCGICTGCRRECNRPSFGFLTSS